MDPGPVKIFQAICEIFDGCFEFLVVTGGSEGIGRAIAIEVCI